MFKYMHIFIERDVWYMYICILTCDYVAFYAEMDLENIAEIENAMNRSISNILKLKALGNSRIAGVNKKAVQLFAVNSNANIYSEEMRKKRILTLKQDDRLEKLGRLFKLWDFDSNGYLDLLEIKVVMHHFKNSMYPHDYFKKAIMSEYVDNKLGYKGFESDPLVTKKEFPFFFLHLCDAHELEKFNETLTMLHRSIVIVSNTIEADKAFKRISPILLLANKNSGPSSTKE